MRVRTIYAAGISLAASGMASPVLAVPDVVASIKPVHSLVAAVMEGVAEPTLLVKGAVSPHTYSLKPSDAEALQGAEIVFWTGHGMEIFLQDVLGTLAGQATSVELSDAAGLELLPIREGGTFKPHDHGHQEGEEHEHEHEEEAHGEHAHAEPHDHEHEGERDMHFWLDPANAEKVVTAIAEALAKADPENAERYQSNAATEIAELKALRAELDATLAPVKNKPFVVFHDAYQYFEQRFGLTVAGSITVSPEVAPGAARLTELQSKIKTLGATCIFAEPQFTPAVINTVSEGTEARTGTLDPEGGSIPEGVELYPTLLRNLAGSMVDCLSATAP